MDAAREKEVEKQVQSLRASRVISNPKNGAETPILPTELKLDIESFSISGYASMYFNRKEGKKPVFGKRRPSLEDILSFSVKPLSNSLNRMSSSLEADGKLKISFYANAYSHIQYIYILYMCVCIIYIYNIL